MTTTKYDVYGRRLKTKQEWVAMAFESWDLGYYTESWELLFFSVWENAFEVL